MPPQSIDALATDLDTLFKGVFVHRFRDVQTVLRCEVTTYLAKWIRNAPTFMLDNSHLKYIGWLLKDREADVRLAALDAIASLLRDDACAGGLSGLVSRFAERLVEMTNDVDAGVAVLAFDVIAEASRRQQLGDVDVSSAEAGLFSESRDVREAAAQFVVSHANACGKPLHLAAIVEIARRQLDEAARTATEEDLSSDDPEVVALVRGFDVVAYGSCVTEYVVDALWSVDAARDVLEDWRAHCELLLNDDKTVSADEPDQFLMLSLLSSCARRAADKNTIALVEAASKKSADLATALMGDAALSKPAQKSVEKMTAAVVDNVVGLIAKYQADAQKVSSSHAYVRSCEHCDVKIHLLANVSCRCTTSLRCASTWMCTRLMFPPRIAPALVRCVGFARLACFEHSRPPRCLQRL